MNPTGGRGKFDYGRVLRKGGAGDRPDAAPDDLADRNRAKQLQFALEEELQILREQIGDMRREFTGDFKALTQALAAQDGDLHEMQLLALRRQVEHLEAALEARDEQVHRHTEERESGLRQELINIRQNLRVAGEAAASGPAGEEALPGAVAEQLGEQIAELRTLLEGQDAAQASALQAELTAMRQEMRATIAELAVVVGRPPETDVVEQQIADLTALVRQSIEQQDTGEQGQILALHNEIASVLEAVREAGGNGSVAHYEEELAALRQQIERLAGDLGNGSQAAVEHIVQAELATLRQDVQAGLDELRQSLPAATDEQTLVTLRWHVAELQSAIEASDERQQTLAESNRRTFEAQLAQLRDELRAAAASLRDTEQNGHAAAPVDLDELRAQIADLRTAFQESSVQQQSAVQEELARLRDELQSMRSSDEASSNGHSAPLDAVIDRILALQSALEARDHQQQESVEAQRMALQAELAEMRQTILWTVEALKEETGQPAGEPLLEELGHRMEGMHTALEQRSAEQQRVMEERERTLHEELAHMRQDFVAALQTVQAVPADGEGEGQAAAYLALHERVGALQVAIDRTNEQLGAMAAASETGVRAELAELRQTLLEAVRPEDRVDELTPLRQQVADLATMIELMDEQRRQTASESAELQQTLLQAVQSLESNGDDGQATALDAFQGLVTALQSSFQEANSVLHQSAEAQRSAVQAELTEIRQTLLWAVESLKEDRAALDAGAPVLDDLHRRIADVHAALENRNADQQQAIAERDRNLSEELARMRQEFVTALQAVTASPSGDEGEGQAAAFLALQERMGELQSSIERANEHQRETADARENALRDELAGLRNTFAQDRNGDLREEIAELRRAWQAATESLRSTPAEETDSADLRQQVSDLVTMLELLEEQRQQSAAEQEGRLAAEIERMRQDVAAALEALQSRAATPEEDGLGGLHAELSRLTEMVSSQRETSQPDVEAALAELREELLDSLRTLQAHSEQQHDVVQDAGLSELYRHVEELQSQLGQSRRELHEASEAQRMALQAELAEMRQTILWTVEALKEETGQPAGEPLLEELGHRMEGMHTALEQRSAEQQRAMEERERTLHEELAHMRQDFVAALQTVQAVPADGEGEGQAAAYLALHERVGALQVAIDRTNEQLGAMAAASETGVRAELAELRQTLLEAVRPEDRVDELTPLRQQVADLATMIELMDEQRRQSADERESEVTAEIERMRQDVATRLEALQTPQQVPEDDGLDDLRERLARLTEMVSVVQEAPIPDIEGALTGLRAEFRDVVEARTETTSGGELESELAALREQIAGLFEAVSAPPAPTDDGARLEVVELRAELHAALEELRQPKEATGAGELAALREEVATLRASLTASEPTDSGELTDSIARLRTDLLAALQSVQAPPEADTGADALQRQVAELAAALERGNQQMLRAEEAYQGALRAELSQIRQELQTSMASLTPANIDDMQRRNAQLMQQQLEMERKFSQLRQDLLAAQSERDDKKKGRWR